MKPKVTAAISDRFRESRSSRTLQNFLVDVVLFVVFVLEMDRMGTGLPVHEWLGIAACAVFVVHILLHWEWIVCVARGLFRGVPAWQRLKLAVDALLFVDMVVVMITGIWISKVAMLQIGVQFEQNFLWRWLHSHSADWAVWLIGLHLALNWRWVVTTLKRYVYQPLRGSRAAAAFSRECTK